MIRDTADRLITYVQDWARRHVPDTYRYGSMASYWDDARAAGIVSDDEYQLVRSRMGDRFYWTGD